MGDRRSPNLGRGIAIDPTTAPADGDLMRYDAATAKWVPTNTSAGEDVVTSDGDTGGAGSAGAGNQYVELNIGGTTYKILHDGTV